MAGAYLIAQARCLLHLSAWAQLGVLTRIYLNAAFGSSCAHSRDSKTLVCTTSKTGALFYDLPANVIGSAVMGLLTPTDSLIRIHSAPVTPGTPLAFLPAQSRLQSNTALHIGLRTGFCGSLTTFASWQLQMVRMLCASGRQTWLAVIVGYYLGTVMSLTSLALGQHLSIWLHSCVTRCPKELTHHDQLHSDPQSALQALPPPLPSPKPPTAQPPTTAFEVEEGTPNDGPSSPPSHLPAPPNPTFCNQLPNTADVASLALLLGLTSFCVYVLVQYANASLRASLFQDYLAVLLGPFGCILRWQLGRLNFKLRGSWAWLPLGTLLANMLACALNFAIASALDTNAGALSTAAAAGMSAVMLGVSGALSTVSTWAVEVQQMLCKSPHEGHGYTYIAISLAGGLLLGVAIYGTSTWALA